MPKVSVIIPVYNTEEYVQRCLNSITAQTLSDIEIICINDCSNDNSLKVLQNYAEKDRRIKLINFKENKGAAAARNAGIEAATGEYLGFVDSDDSIEQCFYENLYNRAIKGGADIVKGSDMLFYLPDGTSYIEKQNEKIKQNKINFWCQYTTCIYKTSFIKKNAIAFPEGLLVGEDPVFAIKAGMLCNKIDIINNAQYYYIRRNNSLNSRFWSVKKVLSYKKYIELITDFALKQNLDRDDHQLFFGRILNDIAFTQKEKSRYQPEFLTHFYDLYSHILKQSFKLPVRLLFDGMVFLIGFASNETRRGIFMVAYNILKRFKNDPRFDITLLLESNYDISAFKNDAVLKDMNIVYSNFILGNKFKNKKIENKNFNPLTYDAYFNPAICFKLNNIRELSQFYILYDAMPMLNNDWFFPEEKKHFWEFYFSLSPETYGFCVSQSSKKEFLRFFDNFNENKLKVANTASSQEFTNQRDKQLLKYLWNKYEIPQESRGNYIFYLGAVDDIRKNAIANIKCFIEFIKRYNITDLFFYLGGSGNKNLEKILELYLAEDYDNYRKYIVPLGYINDEDVNAWFSNSLFFSFLSLHEGFGLPPLEAMMCGTPVICSDNSSLPEVVGDAALLVNAENYEEIIEAFRKMYFDKNLRDEYIVKGLERAKLFTWEKTYKQISDKIINVVSGTIN